MYAQSLKASYIFGGGLPTGGVGKPPPKKCTGLIKMLIKIVRQCNVSTHYNKMVWSPKTVQEKFSRFKVKITLFEGQYSVTNVTKQGFFLFLS